MQKEMLGVPLDWSDPINQGLVMCLRMNEGMGDRIYDGSLNGNHGVLKNMTHPGTPTSGWTPGTRGVGLVFDGTDDYVDCGDLIRPITAITTQAWVKLNDVTEYRVIIGGDDIDVGHQERSFWLRVDKTTGYAKFIIFVSSTAYEIVGNNISDNNWHFVVGTYDGNIARIYVDGVEQNNDSSMGGNIDSGTGIAVGCASDEKTIYHFDGSIDEPRIYNRALSAAEVMKLYIAGNPTSASVGQPVKYFIFDAETTAPSETFALPLEATGTYDFEVSWGDGNTDVISAWDAAAVTHTYASAGTHQIVINGTLLGWRFNNAGDCAKMRDIKSWGCLRLGNSGGYFYGCTGLTVSATDNLNLVGTTTLQTAFRSCSSLTTVPSMNSWDVSSVTSFHETFRTAILFNQNISSWNVSSAISMLGMFYDATVFNQDISSWDISNVTSLHGMFRIAAAFNQDISSWDISSVTTIYRMFYQASSFDQNLGSWNITAVTDATDMFHLITLSTANYDALLTGWEAQAVQNNVTFSGGNSKYSAGAAATARQALIDDHTWVITDGGQV